MAKVLVTSIGTGDIKKDSDSDYLETIYEIEGKEYKNTLTSQPIIEHFRIERVIFIGTSGSMWDNLYFKYGGEDDVYLDLLTKKKQNKTLCQKDLKRLEETLDAYLGYGGSKCLLIEYQKNDEDELWENFETVLSIQDWIGEDDELYLDITHGFRYMPILNIFAMEFLTQLNDRMCPKAILYGMFSGDRSKILDFRVFVDLFAWTRAIGNLRNYGNGFDLLQLIKEAEEGKEIESAFVDFTYSLSLSSMAALQRSVKVIKGKIEIFEKSHHKIIPLVAKELRSFVDRLSIEDTARFQFELARWYAENKNYAMAYITLVEAAITAECKTLGFDENNEDDRNDAKLSIFKMAKKSENSKINISIGETFKKVNDIRKNIAHKLSAEATKTNITPKQSIENFDNYLSILWKLTDS